MGIGTTPAPATPESGVTLSRWGGATARFDYGGEVDWDSLVAATPAPEDVALSGFDVFARVSLFDRIGGTTYDRPARAAIILSHTDDLEGDTVPEQLVSLGVRINGDAGFAVELAGWQPGLSENTPVSEQMQPIGWNQTAYVRLWCGVFDWPDEGGGTFRTYRYGAAYSLDGLGWMRVPGGSEMGEFIGDPICIGFGGFASVVNVIGDVYSNDGNALCEFIRVVPRLPPLGPTTGGLIYP